MLPSRSEYDVLRPLYSGGPQKFDETHYHDTIEFLLSNHMIERIEVKDDAGTHIETQYRITTLGRRAYEECVNFLDEERRKSATLQTEKNANKISIWAIGVSILSFFVALASLIFSLRG